LKLAFSKARPAAAKAIVAAYEQHPKFQKNKDDEIDRAVDVILAAWTFGEFVNFYRACSDALSALAQDAAAQACAQLGVTETSEVFAEAQAAAREWALQRAVAMAGMKLVDGQLVVDAGAQWAITEGTVGFLRNAVDQALRNGWTGEQLSEAINESRAFSDVRAETIADFETRSADVNANMIAYRKIPKVVGMKWLLSDNPCERCVANYEQGYGGIIPITEDWLYPYPVHPNEQCDVAPVVEEG
jgi:hypothetical protein